ncbi:MAG: Type 1 glutamine amidotransferase-like domain-containing protein [Candidatus Falkowbacteria bacterium]|nr:Type 1 glutamine amidotransferase-like domain-containing protein [Candidatus Falkowbacteria bacterium]
MITFKNSFPSDINPVFQMALPDTFEEQVKNADVINIKGGDDHLIQYWLKQFNLSEVFKDKVIVTNSAGSNVMVKHFWTCDWRKNMDGLGILPIKFISHYKSNYGDDDPRGVIEWEKAYKELESYGDKSLPIYALEEGDFIVIEK